MNWITIWENDKFFPLVLQPTGCIKIYCYLLLLFCPLKIMEVSVVGVKLGSYSRSIPFSRLLCYSFRVDSTSICWHLENMRFFVINHISTVLFLLLFFSSQKVRKQKFTRLEWDLTDSLTINRSVFRSQFLASFLSGQIIINLEAETCYKRWG